MTRPANPPVPVARSLQADLASIAAHVPTDLQTTADMLGYRLAIVHDITADNVGRRYRLRHESRTGSQGYPITEFHPGRPPLARVVFLHGGGLIGGHRFDGVDVVARHANELGLTVVTTEYPLTPERDFAEMIRHVLRVLVEVDDGLPLILAGQSAGGGLAAATALAARDAGVQIAGLLLICPMLGVADTASTVQFAHDPCWSAVSNVTAWNAALNQTSVSAPLDADDLSGLPPVYLDSGSAELFRGAVSAFAGAVWAVGGRAELHVWSGAFHGSDGVNETAVVSREAHRSRGEWLRRLLIDDV